MILTIALLLSFQLAGLLLVTLFGLPVPGPVMGMVLFLFALMTVNGLLEKTLPVVNVLLAHFALLFVPAGVGIIEHFDRLQAEWLPMMEAAIGSHHRLVHPRYGHNRIGDALGGSTSARLEQKGEASCLIRFFLN